MENASTALNRYVSDNPLFEERMLEVKLLRQLIGAVEEQNKESFVKFIEDTPLSPLRVDQILRSLAEDVTKEINGDINIDQQLDSEQQVLFYFNGFRVRVCVCVQ